MKITFINTGILVLGWSALRWCFGKLGFVARQFVRYDMVIYWSCVNLHVSKFVYGHIPSRGQNFYLTSSTVPSSRIERSVLREYGYPCNHWYPCRNIRAITDIHGALSVIHMDILDELFVPLSWISLWISIEKHGYPRVYPHWHGSTDRSTWIFKKYDPGVAWWSLFCCKSSTARSPVGQR